MLNIIKYFLLITCLHCITFFVYGQQEKPVVSFDENEFNFGTIKETDGIIIHDFRFTNKGRVPLIIKDVKSSCGCTVPEWTQEPVLPDHNGSIKVSFNPQKQSGAINKTIQIVSNADIPQITLGLKGVVIPADRVEELYKFTIGDLRLQTIYAALGEIYKGKSGIYAIRVYNNSFTQPARITFKKIPAHLKINIKPEVIEPQQEGLIEIEYITTGLSNWDYVADRLDFMINGKDVPNNRINVTANIKEDFSGLTAEDMAIAPRAVFDNPQHDFGRIPEDGMVEHSFKLTNTGKSNLYIRKVTASCGCTAVQPAKTTILPGDSADIKAVFNAHGREGNQKKAITVITNDPKHSRSILWINAVVEKKINNGASQ